jgi:hypothetical protein
MAGIPSRLWQTLRGLDDGFHVNSQLLHDLARKNVFRLKAELNTFPKFFYFYD